MIDIFGGFWFQVSAPLIAALVLAVVIPRGFARVIPEGLSGLVWNGVASAAVMFALSFAYFVWSYTTQNAALTDLFGANPRGSFWHFARLATLSALLWVPIIVLTVAALPRHWKVVEW
jgi:hypothetical protein